MERRVLVQTSERSADGDGAMDAMRSARVDAWTQGVLPWGTGGRRAVEDARGGSSSLVGALDALQWVEGDSRW